MKFCANCGQLADSNSRFCTACGAALPDVAAPYRGFSSPEPTEDLGTRTEDLEARSTTDGLGAESQVRAPSGTPPHPTDAPGSNQRAQRPASGADPSLETIAPHHTQPRNHEGSPPVEETTTARGTGHHCPTCGQPLPGT